MAASDLALESRKVAGNTALSQSTFGNADHVFIALKFAIGSGVFSALVPLISRVDLTLELTEEACDVKFRKKEREREGEGERLPGYSRGNEKQFCRRRSDWSPVHND